MTAAGSVNGGDPTRSFDVAIVGAGPCGLTLANMLGMRGASVGVFESRSDLIDYPRGVGIDDECLRTFQAIGLVDGVLEHVVPNQLIIYVTGSGRELARMAPTSMQYGWPRRNGFIQPLVDEVLLRGLERFERVKVFWDHTLRGYSEQEQGVELDVVDEHGEAGSISARYLVGCDGGRSTVRKQLGVAFEGLSNSTSWLVVDLRNDPLGTLNCYVGCDPARPYISIGLPHGIRRFEFLLFHGEGEEMSETSNAARLIQRFIPDPTRIDLVRARVYTHHARVASSFGRGRVLLAGDAAHLMPVWQGQGYNTGVRDASNLGWKLDYVLRGISDPALLDTYDQERRPHAAAMVRLSELTGRFLSPTNRLIAGTRDLVSRGLKLVPPVRDYVVQMRFKPMPTYLDGAVVRPAAGSRHVVGRLFIQPEVMTADGSRMRLDDVLEHRLAVLQWGVDPRNAFNKESLNTLRRVGTRFVTILSLSQYGRLGAAGDDELRVVADVTGALRSWLNEHAAPIVFLRPDRIILAGVEPMGADATVAAIEKTLHFSKASQEPHDAELGAGAPVPPTAAEAGRTS